MSRLQNQALGCRWGGIDGMKRLESVRDDLEVRVAMLTIQLVAAFENNVALPCLHADSASFAD